LRWLCALLCGAELQLVLSFEGLRHKRNTVIVIPTEAVGFFLRPRTRAPAAQWRDLLRRVSFSTSNFQFLLSPLPPVPSFCLAFDAVLGAFLAARLLTRPNDRPALHPCATIRTA